MNEHILLQSCRSTYSRRRILLTGISILASLASNRSFAQAPSWRQFRRDDLGFVIEFPDEPTVRDEPESDPDSDLIRSFQATSKFANMEFSLGCEEYRTVIDPEQIWGHVADVYTHHIPGIRLASVINVPGKYPTRHYVAEPDPSYRGPTGFMSSTDMVTEKKWIDWMVISDRPIETDPLARRFFDSFSLV